MRNIPDEIRSVYEAALEQRKLPLSQRAFHLKWLRYYLDFCHKYAFAAGKQASLPAFVKKLRSKGQSEKLCAQAQEAVSLFYEIRRAQEEEHVDENQKLKSGDNPAPAVSSLPAAPSAPLDAESVPRSAKIPVNAPWQKRGKYTVAESEPEYREPKPQGSSWVAVYEGLRAEIKLRHYSPKTLASYQGWMRKFQAFVKSKDSSLLTQQEVKDFLTHLAVEKKVAASTQNQAFNALLFLFKQVLKTEFGEINDVPRAKRRPYIPVVLSRQEIDAVIEHLRPPFVLPVLLLYGCGLRISECLNLRLQDFNLDAGMLTVHNGKGQKDRTVPLPQSVMAEIQQQFEVVAALYDADIAAGYAGVFLPDNLDGKYKNAGKEFSWQWFFPAKTLTFVSETKERKRYHLHDTQLQKAIKAAVKRAKLLKRASAHTFRHSFASHLVQAHYDIRTVQALMGHSDVKTTMIYLQTVPSLTLKEAKSPLDFKAG